MVKKYFSTENSSGTITTISKINPKKKSKNCEAIKIFEKSMLCSSLSFLHEIFFYKTKNKLFLFFDLYSTDWLSNGTLNDSSTSNLFLKKNTEIQSKENNFVLRQSRKFSSHFDNDNNNVRPNLGHKTIEPIKSTTNFFEQQQNYNKLLYGKLKDLDPLNTGKYNNSFFFIFATTSVK